VCNFSAYSDAELIEASAGDADAFRELYNRYAARLHRFFARRGVSTDSAVDLVAETFAQAWSSRKRYRDLAGGSAGPWLFVIARRVLLTSVRRGVLERRALERLQVEWRISSGQVPGPDALAGIDDDVELAIAELPLAHRRALELRVLSGLSYAAISHELGCSAVAARIRVSRGLAHLRAQLDGRN